jgi:hypothetical protein
MRRPHQALLVAARVAGAALVGGAVCGAVPLAAQDSQFGIRGLGTPGRFETVRARSTGGAFGPFDGLSPLTEAALADLPQLAATAMGGTSYRSAAVAGATTALRTSRFPVMGLAGPVFHGVVLGAGFTTYLDRSWAVTIRDSLPLRGKRQPYSDQLTSDGGVTDLHLAAAMRVFAHLTIGAAVHVLSGSTRESVARTFDDTTYHAIQQRDEVRYDGLGVSGSALLYLLPGLRLAAFARSDNRLRARLGDTVTTETPLPKTLGAGLAWAPSPSVRFAGTVVRRSWADAGAGAFNTLNWSAGLEVGAGFSPLRVGVRGGQLPFGTGPTAPTEFGVAAGTGRAFAQGRALIDVGVERLERKGGGLSERVWTFMLGLSVRP